MARVLRLVAALFLLWGMPSYASSLFLLWGVPAYASSLNYTTTPTVTASQYTSGEVIGGLITLPAQNGVITDIAVSSNSGQTPTISVYLLNRKPSSSSVITDQKALSLAATDTLKMRTTPVSVTLAVPTGGSGSIGSATALAMAYQNLDTTAGGSGQGQILYIILVSGSTFTPTSTSDINVTVGLVSE